MTVFMWSARASAEEWGQALDEIRAAARRWFRTTRAPRSAAAARDADALASYALSGGDPVSMVLPTVFHPPGVIRVMTPAEEAAEVHRLYGSASAGR